MKTALGPNKKTARIAGFLYLIVAVFSIFSFVYMDLKIYVPDDAATTACNILSSELLFRLSFISSIIYQIAFLFLVCALYKLFNTVDKDQAILMVIFVVVSIPIALLNMLNQFAPLLLLNGSVYLSAFNSAQLQALSMVFIEMYNYGIFITQIFWGLWLFPLGKLVFKSGFSPKWLGVLLMISCFGYIIESLVMFLFPGYEVITYPGLMIATVAEFSLIFWLLFKGSKL